MQNLFYSYMARLHQKEDLEFVLRGLTRLLSNPLTRTYLPSSRKRISFVEELLVLTWKLMEANKVCGGGRWGGQAGVAVMPWCGQ